MPHLRWIALLVLATMLGTRDEARAAKEKFVRSKPHVNFSGPLHLAGETLTVRLGLLLPAVQAGRPAPACSGLFDLRVVSAADPDGTPLAESADVRVAAGGTAQVSFNASSPTPVDVYVVVYAREMEGVKTPDCVLRGRIETTDNATGATTRSLPLRASEFVALKKN
jgi:hypothetical protein